MNLDLTSKVALVTGSSRGIGKAIAAAFLQEGARTVITGRNESNLNATAKELEAIAGADRLLRFSGDLTDEAIIQRCISEILTRWKRLDVVVANIGSGRASLGWEAKATEWDRVFQINLWGSLAVIRQSVPVMIEGGGGAIVVISSIAGLEAIGAPAPYAAAKSALNAACKSLSKDLARHNIRVNIVAPGNVFFLGGTWDKKQQENPAAVRHYLETHVPMQRLGEPREIANIVAFVASPRASFMTGSCVVVDGGQTRAL